TERQPFTVEVSDPSILEAQPDDSPLDPNANVVRLTGRSVGEAEVIVKIEGAVVARFRVEVLQIAGFEPVKVALNIIPEEMASQLFGKEVSNNFYTVKVRIFNNLLDSRNQRRLGQSIIAYSSSIETAISLEKMYDVKSKTQPPAYALTPVIGTEGEVKKEQKWYPVKAEEMVSDYPAALANPDNPLPPDFSLSDTSHPLRPVSSVVTGQLLRFQLQDVPTTGTSLDFPTLHWKSSDDQILSVDQWGNGTAKKSGTVTVTAVYGGHLYAETVVIRNDVPAKSEAILLQRALPLRIGWWARFLLPDQPDQKAVGNANTNANTNNARYLWKSTDSDVALLHDQTLGLALGQKPGFATIIVSDGNSQTYAATVMVMAGDAEGAVTPSLFREKGNWRYLSHIFRYRPFTYEMMINTFDQREQQSTRSKGFRLLDGLIGLGSFAAAFKGFQGSGTASALNGISGIITPTARNVFPNMSEVQRQNMVTQLMKPIEEIPFGADIERVLFYPKMPFKGLIEGHLVRISRVHTSYFNISVAIIEKRHSSQLNNAAETPQAIALQ
ncbi:MAG TPA: hypothetical protein VGB77_14345, partial [Abditibacteriaceae bacterium]